MPLPLLPIGIQGFDKLRESKCVYVDKTELINQLVTTGSVYFLSRPRRFGKSLLISTLEALFQGRRELFEGLWIAEKSNWEWKPHPVIRIDLSQIPTKTPESLETGLRKWMLQVIAEHNLQIEEDQPSSTLLRETIYQLSKRAPVVVLIDEYDKPIIDHIGLGEDRLTIAQANREVMRNFYTVLKGSDENMRFLLLTGVSRFSKVSIFSALNHLQDISLDARYASLLGYTQEELESYFAPHLQALAEHLSLSQSETLNAIRFWYNGYRFSKDPVRVYNPFSTLLLLQQKDFRTYWFESGTPTFLLEMIRRQPDFQPQSLEGHEVSDAAFGSYELHTLDKSLIQLLLQTGYLTIRDCWTLPGSVVTRYRLDYPNEEVRQAFTECLLQDYSGTNTGESAGALDAMVAALQGAKLDLFFQHLRSLFAAVPYSIQIPAERYYQSLFYLIHRMLGFQIHVEVQTHTGRIDSVIETDKRIYLFEFKMGRALPDDLAKIKALEDLPNVHPLLIDPLADADEEPEPPLGAKLALAALRQIQDRAYYESSAEKYRHVGAGAKVDSAALLLPPRNSSAIPSSSRLAAESTLHPAPRSDFSAELEPYLQRGKPITLVGVAFVVEQRLDDQETKPIRRSSPLGSAATSALDRVRACGQPKQGAKQFGSSP